MALIDKLYNSCVLMSQKATKGMVAILQKRLYAPIRSNGIISHTDISVTKDGQIITIETHFPDYAYFVEYGRAKGKRPPIGPIRDWCYLHNLPEGMEWYIQKQIGKRGTQGKHFLLPLQRMMEMLQKTMSNVAKVDIVATYNNMVYENTNIMKQSKLTL